MKQSNKTEWAIWGVCALSFAVTLALLPLLPARIPVHWNVDGQIDGWAARPGAFFGLAMGLGLSLLMKFLPYIDPRRRSYEKFGRAYDAFRLALALFVLILQGVTLYAAFYPDGLDVSRIIAACVGALLCVAGSFFLSGRWLAAATAALGAVLVVPAYLYSYFIYKSSGED